MGIIENEEVRNSEYRSADHLPGYTEIPSARKQGRSAGFNINDKIPYNVVIGDDAHGEKFEVPAGFQPVISGKGAEGVRLSVDQIQQRAAEGVKELVMQLKDHKSSGGDQSGSPVPPRSRPATGSPPSQQIEPAKERKLEKVTFKGSFGILGMVYDRVLISQKEVVLISRDGEDPMYSPPISDNIIEIEHEGQLYRVVSLGIMFSFDGNVFTVLLREQSA